MLLSLCILVGCGESSLTFDEANNIITNKHPEALIMSCEKCDEPSDYVIVRYRKYDPNVEKCAIWKTKIDTQDSTILTEFILQ